MARKSVSSATAENVLTQNGLLQDVPSDTGPVEDDTPPYMLAGGASIPVSKKSGNRWKERIANAMAAYDSTRGIWQKAMDDYRACNGSDRPGDTGDSVDSANHYFRDKTDENMTRETVKTILRTSYSNNPTVTITSTDPDDDPMVQVLQEAVRQLFNRFQSPGLNMKPKVQRWIIFGHLTNFGVMKLDYQTQKGSRQEAQQNLLRLQEQVSKENDQPKLEELYSELELAEEELSTTRVSGAIVTNPQSHALIIDDNATALDGSDANWMAEAQFLSNSYIKKRFLKKNEEGVWVRISDGKTPGQGIGNAGVNERDIRETIADEIMGATPDAIVNARVKDKTKCWIIWDKLTRQIQLWVDGTWDWPLWVWQDDLKLSRFFPYFILAFTPPIDAVVQEGEQAQYSGQQDEINRINKRVSFIRKLAFGQIIYNTRKLDKGQADLIVSHMRNPNEFEALGLDWDPESKLKDMFDLFVPPDTAIQALYDKSDLYRVANRVNNQNEVSQGGQFKTNTTNKAVQAYAATANSVKNELTDAIEDGLSDFIWALLELIVSKYDKEQITALVGKTLGDQFQNLSVEEFNQQYSCTIAPGTTEKPTSDSMKQEAMQIAQAVGQVGQAAPLTSLKIIFRMFTKAFSNFLFGPEDQKMLETEATANLTKGQSVPGAGPQQPPPGGAPHPPTPGAPPPQPQPHPPAATPPPATPTGQ